MPWPADPTSPESVLAEVAAQTLALVGAVQGWTDDDLLRPSALPGWTRGHVVSHVVNHADAVTEVLLKAADGHAASLYPSQEARDRMIEAGARRPAAEAAERLAVSGARMLHAWRVLPRSGLDVDCSAPSGWTRPVSDLPWLRWREVALHRVDLGSVDALDSADPLVQRLVDETVAAFSGRDGVPPLTLVATDTGRTSALGGAGAGASGPEVRGTTADLALWLTGRSAGAGRAPTSSSDLPVLPPWP